MPIKKKNRNPLLTDALELLAECADNDVVKNRIRAAKTLGAATTELTQLFTGVEKGERMSPTVERIHLALTRLIAAYTAKSQVCSKQASASSNELQDARQTIDVLNARVMELHSKIDAMSDATADLRSADNEIKDLKASVRALRMQLPVGFLR